MPFPLGHSAFLRTVPAVGLTVFPAVWQGNEEATVAFQKISEAYSILSGIAGPGFPNQVAGDTRTHQEH